MRDRSARTEQIIKACVEMEVANTLDASTMFRRNNMSLRILKHHLHKVGTKFLEVNHHHRHRHRHNYYCCLPSFLEAHGRCALVSGFVGISSHADPQRMCIQINCTFLLFDLV